MKRNVIKIDEKKCNGCGLCIPGCPEGAIQIIDGKARLVSDLFCDGLGACLGHCPEGAITIEEREAEPYDERKVMENIIPKGKNTIRAHLQHLIDHNEMDYYSKAIEILDEKKIDMVTHTQETVRPPMGCPGSRTLTLSQEDDVVNTIATEQSSALTHWPIQLHLMSPNAPHYQQTDVLLAADCSAFSAGNFHNKYLRGKTLAIACPKLDEGTQIYVEKLTALIDEAKINTLTVLMMQVPCCSVLLSLAQIAAEKASRKVPIKAVIISFKGDVLQEKWL